MHYYNGKPRRTNTGGSAYAAIRGASKAVAEHNARQDAKSKALDKAKKGFVKDSAGVAMERQKKVIANSPYWQKILKKYK